MKKKSMIHKLIILIFIASIILKNPITVAANEDLNGFTTLNEKNTAINNKYGITGKILKIYQESNSSVVLTMDGIYYIYNGEAKKYTFDGTILNTTTFYKSGQNVYVSPILQTDSSGNKIYVEIKLDLTSNSNKVTTNYSEYMDKINLMWGHNFDSISTFTDAYNNKWFTLFYNGSDKYYVMYRIDTLGTIKEVEYLRNPYKAYDKLSVDSDKNVYYSYRMKNTYINGKVYSELIKMDKNLTRKSIIVYGTIYDFEIGLAGDIWVLSSTKTLKHLDKNGKELATIPLTNGKDISITASGYVYVLDDNKVKLVYNNKLYIKQYLNSSYPYYKLSMKAKDNLAASNENSFESIKGDSKEIIVSDAAVKCWPYIVKDNKGNITILSKNSDTQKDKNLKMYRIGSSGISFHNFSMDPGNYNMAFGYDGSIYIPRIDKYSFTIYRINSDYKVEKYVTINNVNFIGMQMDSNKNLYILTNQCIYKVSPTKKIQGNDITQEKGGYNNAISGFIKDKYNNIYIKYLKINYGQNPLYSLLKINDNLDIKQVKLSSTDIYANLIFVTSKNEIAMINANQNGNQMYLVDLNGNPVKDTTYDGVSYYTQSMDKLVKIWKAYDGTIFYERYRQLSKKTSSEEVWVANIEQAMGDSRGALYYTDYSNLYIYDKQLPKISSTYPVKSQTKVPVTSKITLKLSEPVRKGIDFSGISLSVNGTKVSVSCTLVDNKIVITPKTNLKSNAKYTVSIPMKAVRDVVRNTLSSEYTYTFTTQ